MQFVLGEMGRGEGWIEVSVREPPLMVATGMAVEVWTGIAKNGVVNYFSKCCRSDSRLSFLPRSFRVEASRGRWLFQFPGVPTRLNFYRLQQRRRRRRRRWLAADHFARYRVTGLCLRKWLRASRFFSVMLPLRSRGNVLFLSLVSALCFPLSPSLFVSIFSLPALLPSRNHRSVRRIEWMGHRRISRWSTERPRIASRQRLLHQIKKSDYEKANSISLVFIIILQCNLCHRKKILN